MARCGYQMYLLPLPLSQVDHSNLLFSSATPPLSSHQVQRGTMRYIEERPMCVWSDWPYLAVTPIKFPLKAAPVYCIFSSSCRVLEVCTFHSSSGCSTAFFPLYYSIEVSSFIFSLLLLFHLTLSFSKAIGPFLTLLGPRNLPAYPTRCTIGYLTCGRRLFGAKTVFMILHV